MPLSWNEIRDRALGFSREWKDESSEDAEAKSFWDAFFKVFGITRRRIAAFELPVKTSDGKGGYIDLLWKGVLLVEHKSRGLDLDRAFHQATDYFHGLKERDLPRYVLVSDFARFRLYDLDEKKTHEFPINELRDNVRLFDFIAGYQTHSFGVQDPVNIKAAEKLGKLHDLLKAVGYDGHALELFLVRLLFCLFAQKNAIFETQQFYEWIEKRTAEDGSDLGGSLAHLFQVLNTPPEKRARNLDEHLAAFRYINGRLFEEAIPVASIDRNMREIILDCSSLDWSRISPAIFGALFQSIKDKKARRNLGEHYTSETNILKALRPLFLDSLRAEFDRVRRDSTRLKAFHDKLGTIRILDPACGCGNFLVIAYRELRLLELDVLRELFKATQEGRLDVSTIVFVDVDQFYGIELEEFPAQIAQVALWMTDHQMNQLVSADFGQYFARLPLKKSPTISYDNALAADWTKVVSPKDLSYIVGNPPFIGKALQSATQKAELLRVFKGVKSASILDYVSCWYQKAAEYMFQNKAVLTAFVSTNSITQGEQIGVLWPQLCNKGIRISFAHRTFVWSSEARGKAAVHCVIIGFGYSELAEKKIFEYADPKAEPLTLTVNRINPYLVDAADIFLENRRRSICNVPAITFGSMANDDGHLLMNDAEKKELVKGEPGAAKWIRPFMQVDELLYGSKRWCLWLTGITPKELVELPLIRKRVLQVQNYRKLSPRAETKELAKFPSLFGEIRQPVSEYFVIPCHTGQDRKIIPIAKVSARTICGNANLLMADHSVYAFGVITSLMHMSWVRAVCGRIKSDYRYSAGIVYNNFPWPEPTEKQRKSVEVAAQAVFDERKLYPDSNLASLYDPVSMPPNLAKAHNALDRSVDAAYGRTFKTEAERVAFLFGLYEKMTSLFSENKKPKRRKGQVA